MLREITFRVFLILGSLALLTGFGLLALSQIGQYEAHSSAPDVAANAWSHPGAAALLSCARLKSRNIIFPEGGRNLLKGPVWLGVTAPPGAHGNFVVAAHRDTHFRFLKDVQVGDVFDVEAPTGRSRYRVSGLHIVDPKDRRLLGPHVGGVLTLVTCYPFYYTGHAPKRFIVRADLLTDNEPLITSIPTVKVSPGETLP